MPKRKTTRRRRTTRRAPRMMLTQGPPAMPTSSLRKQLWVTSPYRASFDKQTPNKLRNMGDGPIPTCGTWRVSSSWW